MIKKVKLICLLLSISFLLPTLMLPASAGVPKKLVEVGEAERQRLEEERVRLQEEYEKEAAKLEEERQRLEGLEAQRRKEQERLEILALAERMREQEIDAINASIAAGASDDQVVEEPTSTAVCATRCNFFCAICKVITLPLTVLATIVPGDHHDVECHLCNKLFK